MHRPWAVDASSRCWLHLHSSTPLQRPTKCMSTSKKTHGTSFFPLINRRPLPPVNFFWRAEIHLLSDPANVMSQAPGSIPKAIEGGRSVTRIKNRICRGVRMTSIIIDGSQVASSNSAETGPRNRDAHNNANEDLHDLGGKPVKMVTSESSNSSQTAVATSLASAMCTDMMKATNF